MTNSNKNFNSIQLKPGEVLLSGSVLNINGEYPLMKKFEKESRDKVTKDGAPKKFTLASFPVNIKLQGEDPVKVFLNAIAGQFRIIPSMYPPKVDPDTGREIKYDNIALNKDAEYKLIEVGKDPNRRKYNLTGLEVSNAYKEYVRSKDKTLEQNPDQDPQP